MDKWIDGLSKATYLAGGALVIGDWLSFLDAHAKAFGVIIGGATFLANLTFQYLRYSRDIKVKDDDQ